MAEYMAISEEMAAKLSINRTGQMSSGQRRTVLVAGVLTLLFLLCPLTMLLQMVGILLAGSAPAVTTVSALFTVVGVLFMVMFVGLIGTNVQRFLPEAFGRQPVRYARGNLRVRASEGHRPELPFSYIIDDYSFAPYVVPQDVEMRPGAPYVVYYSRRSRLLLSIAALDKPDAAQWEPQFENPPAFNWH